MNSFTVAPRPGLGGMFSRRAAASEGGFARDESKRSVLRLLEKREQAVSDQLEKVAELRRVQEGIQNAAIKAAVGFSIKAEEEKLAELRSRMAELDRQLKLPMIVPTVDVLAEIHAHEVPLGKVSAKDEATVYDISIPPPDPSVPVPPQPTTSAVVAEIYRESGMTYAGSRSGKSWFGMLAASTSPSNMLQTQSHAMEKRLGRPLRPREVAEMQQSARATVMASASVLVGTFCCLVGAAFAGVVIWRRYGKPRTSEELARATEQVQTAQKEREARLRESVGPVVNNIKMVASATLHQHGGLANLAAGLSTTTATRYVPPTTRHVGGSAAGKLAEELGARPAGELAARSDAAVTRTDAADYAKIAAAEAAWQASLRSVTSADTGVIMGTPKG